MEEIIISESMPVLALRGLTVFPQTTIHFDVGREKSIRALDRAMSADQRIFLVTQKDILQDDPSFEDLYEVGTVAHVRQVLKCPGIPYAFLFSESIVRRSRSASGLRRTFVHVLSPFPTRTIREALHALRH